MTKIFSRHLGTPHDALKLFLGCAMLLGMGSHGHCTGYSKREIRLLVAGVVAKVGALIWGHSEPIPPKQNGIFRSLDSTTR